MSDIRRKTYASEPRSPHGLTVGVALLAFLLGVRLMCDRYGMNYRQVSDEAN